MLENELVLVIRFQDNGVLIEAFDFASQRYPRHQINCRLCLVFPYIVQKYVLNVLNLFFHSILSRHDTLFPVHFNLMTVFFGSIPFEQPERVRSFILLNCRFEEVLNFAKDGRHQCCIRTKTIKP